MDRSIVNMSQQEKLAVVHSLRSEGLKIDEIAERTGIPRSSVGKYLKSPLVPVAEIKSHSGSKPDEILEEILSETQEISLETGSLCETLELKFQNKLPGIFSWREFLRCMVLSIPLLSLLPWLVCTSASVYKKDVGDFWGWVIALGIECFTVSIAAFLPKLDCRLSSPGDLFKSLPILLKAFFHYALLLGLCFYSYTTTSLTVSENRMNSISEIRNSSLKTENMSELRAEKSQMLRLISTYEKSGWLGEIRKIREDVRAIDAKLESEQTNAGFVDSETLAVVEHRSLVGKSLRLVVLFIVAYCLHVIAKLLPNRQH